jgi:hypothetical protein
MTRSTSMLSKTLCACFALAWVGSAACNSRATASDPQSEPRPEQKSREFETCSATPNCGPELACFDQVCRRTSRSVVGDYFAAVGARAFARGDADGAVAGYTEALAKYDADKVPLPPEIDCAYGAALAQNKARKEQTELAARVLHRCVLSVPVGASLRQRALNDLASLADAGLEPSTLAKTTLADLYLTRVPLLVNTTHSVTVSAVPVPAGKSFVTVMETLNSDLSKSTLMNCWETFNATTKRDALTIEVGSKARYVEPEYIEDRGRFVISLDGTAGAGASAEVAADACVRTAIDAACKRVVGLKDAFATKFVVKFQ